jgi:predicted Zn-dependent protease
MMKKSRPGWFITFLFLVSGLLLAACGADADLPELPAGFTRFHDEELGLTFAYPEAWLLSESPRVRVVASNQALLDNPSISPANMGSLASVAVGNTDQLEMEDPLEIVNFMLDASGARGQVEILEDPTATTINGHPAAVVTMGSVNEGLPLTLRLAVIRHGQRIVTVSTATPTVMASETGPQLDSLINSVKILASETLSGSEE